MRGCLSQHSHVDALVYFLPNTELVQTFYDFKYNSGREIGNCKKKQKFISNSVSLKRLQLLALVSNWQKNQTKIKQGNNKEPKQIMAALFRAN